MLGETRTHVRAHMPTRTHTHCCPRTPTTAWMMMMMMMMMMMIIMLIMMMTTETLIMIGSVPLTLMILVMLMTLEMAMATNMMMFEPLIIVSPSDRTQLASRLGERARANACVHVRMHACVGRLFAGTCSQQHCSRRTCGVIENLILDQLILAIVWWMFFAWRPWLVCLYVQSKRRTTTVGSCVL